MTAPVAWDVIDYAPTLYARVNELCERLRREFPEGKRSAGLRAAMRDLDIACLELETTSLIEAGAGVERVSLPDAVWLKVLRDGGSCGLVQ